MEAFAELIFRLGGTVVLAALFVYVYIEDRKDRKEDREDRKEDKKNNTRVLEELSASNKNIAESLNLLKTSIDNNTAEYRQHDDRAVQQFSNINEKLIRIEEKIGK